jgi:UDP-perosamine 4-acetyltransferase
MTKATYVLGAGGHGRVVLDALLASGMHVKGILDSGMEPGYKIFNIPVIGGDEHLDSISTSEVVLVNGIGANPVISYRKELFRRLKEKEFEFVSLLHPTVSQGRECVLSEGSQIMAGVVMQNRVRLGVNSVVNTRASIDHDCVVGDHVFVSPGTILCGEVTISDSSFIGAGVILLPGVQIGANAVVGAGSVVRKDVPDGWIVAGNPAVRIGVNS